MLLETRLKDDTYIQIDAEASLGWKRQRVTRTENDTLDGCEPEVLHREEELRRRRRVAVDPLEHVHRGKLVLEGFDRFLGVDRVDVSERNLLSHRPGGGG